MELEIEIRDHNIGVTVTVHIAGVNPHAGSGIAVSIECNFCLQSGIHKGSVVLVQQQEIG